MDLDKIIDNLVETLSSDIPKGKINTDYDDNNYTKHTNYQEKIKQKNQEAKDIITSAFGNYENSRIINQRILLIFTLVILAIQLVGFNVMMFYLINKFGANNISLIFDLFKYYLGTVVIELIGLVVIIVKNSFSTKLDKLMEKILEK